MSIFSFALPSILPNKPKVDSLENKTKNTTPYDPKTYICLDTNVVIDCAYARKERNTPSLLKQIVSCCEQDNIMLLVPEIVLLELEPASNKTMQSAQQSLKEISAAIDSIRDGVLYGEPLKKLKRSVKETEEIIAQQAQKIITDYRRYAYDSNKALIIPLSASAILEAIKIAIEEKKPSKQKAKFGLLQQDCLIVACLKKFINQHSDDRVILCSNNTADFAEAKDNPELHHEILEHLKGVIYFSNPVDALQEILPTDEKEDSEKEIQELRESYKAVAERPKQITFPGLSDAIINATAFANGNIATSNLSKSFNEYQNLVGSQIPMVHNSAIEAAQQLVFTNSSPLSSVSAAFDQNIQPTIQNLIESEVYRSAIASSSNISDILNSTSMQAINIDQETISSEAEEEDIDNDQGNTAGNSGD